MFRSSRRGGVGNARSIWSTASIDGKADAVLAASIFHYGEFTVAPGERGDGGARASRSGCEPRYPVKRGGSTR